MTDWRLPYRSMDASGGPETATAVGWAWIEAEGLRAQAWFGGAVCIETTSNSEGTTVIALYRATRLIACATIFRDPMNFAVLVRWREPYWGQTD